MTYIIIFAVLIGLSYQYDYLGKKSYRITCYISMLLIFILLAGLRYRIGVDSIRYELEYATMPSFNIAEIKRYFETSRYNIGFIITVAISKSISNDFILYQIIESTYVNCVMFWFFFKHTNKIFLALAIYFVFYYFTFTCEVLREACAVSSFLLAYPYFVKSKWLKYYMFSFLALSFHISAIICFILPILYLPCFRPIFTVGKRTIYILIGLLTISFLIGSNFFTIINLYLSAIGGVEKLVKSYENSTLSESIFNFKGIITFILKNIAYPFGSIMILKMHKGHTLNRFQKINSHFDFMVALFCYFAIISIPIALLYRVCNYFFAFTTIAICNASYNPIVIKKRKYKLKYDLWLMILLPLFFLQIYGYMEKIPSNKRLRNGMVYYPYYSRLNPQLDANREEIFRLYNTM